MIYGVNEWIPNLHYVANFQLSFLPIICEIIVHQNGLDPLLVISPYKLSQDWFVQDILLRSTKAVLFAEEAACVRSREAGPSAQRLRQDCSETGAGGRY